MIGEAMNIEDFIPEGRENAISRADLHRITGLPDRTIRAEIKRANRRITLRGEAIISSSSAKGYWKTSDIGELMSYIRESEHRQRATEINDEPVYKLVARLTKNKSIPVRRHMRHLSSKEKPARRAAFFINH